MNILDIANLKECMSKNRIPEPHYAIVNTATWQRLSAQCRADFSGNPMQVPSELASNPLLKGKKLKASVHGIYIFV